MIGYSLPQSHCYPAVRGPRRRPHLSGRVPRAAAARAHAAHPCALPPLHLAEYHHPPARRARFLSASPTCSKARRSPSSTPSRTFFSPSSTASPSTPRTTCATSAFPLQRRRHAANRTHPPRARQQALLRTRGPLLSTSKKFSTRSTSRFFGGLLGRPELTWSEHHAKRSLGHYDAAHNTIVVSRVFDRPSSPRYAIEYLLYHEMLHLKHPVRTRGLRRCVHSARIQSRGSALPATR